PVMISIRSSALKNVLKLALKIRNHHSPQQGALHRTDTIHLHFRTTRGDDFVGHIDDEILLKPGGSIYFGVNG
ncbi:hypothetical protein, partial [Gluconacetobacter diazotrophicus]|uniref:hypothetical protein n=1 Tax=Gluconacetobacter diazotrophicus TaxID=33996 RepID=UPI001C7E3717